MMLEPSASASASARTVAAPNATQPAFRDRMPTLPQDLSAYAEYAREHTGPASWSAHPRAESLSAWTLDSHVDPALARATDVLVDVSPTDVPRCALTPREVSELVCHREAFVLASIDGSSTLEVLLDTLDLPSGEVLSTICALCVRGLVVLDRSGRLVNR